ncbi:MAG: phenylalanine--tRNA ligase subunit beta, partial [Anaerolineales bacterium]
QLPEEQDRLVLAITGPRQMPSWQDSANSGLYDFYDLKGIVESMLSGLHVDGVSYQSQSFPSFHPGKSAAICTGDTRIGIVGELHPVVHSQYNFGDAPVMAAIFFLDQLREVSPQRHEVEAVSAYPQVLEDIALIVDETVPAGEVTFLIDQTGGKQVTDVRLFDVYRGEQIGAGKKSLAYRLTFQAEDRTLTDNEVAKIRTKIVKRLEREVNAQLRDQ